jgi:hypothetical protein
MNRFAKMMIMRGGMDRRNAPYGSRNFDRRRRMYDRADDMEEDARYRDRGEDYGYDSRRRYDRGDREDMRRYRDRADENYDRAMNDSDYDYMDEDDGRRGVKGTGPYGIGGRRYYGRRRDRGSMPFSVEGDIRYDDYDYDYDMADYAGQQQMKLSKKDIQTWKRKMMNADGSHGEHFDMQQIMSAAEKLGIKFKEYDEKELCITANMLYSDYCEVFKSLVPKDKEDVVYTKMAQAFLEDEDAPEGSEKLALYYKCIVDDDE